MRVRLPVGRQARPRVLDGFDARERNAGRRREVPGEPRRERFDVIDRILPGERIHRVLHRIGRQAGRVVTVRVNRLERAFERDAHGQVHDFVRPAPAADLQQPHVRFAVSIPGEHLRSAVVE